MRTTTAKHMIGLLEKRAEDSLEVEGALDARSAPRLVRLLSGDAGFCELLERLTRESPHEGNKDRVRRMALHDVLEMREERMLRQEQKPATAGAMI